MIDTGLSIQERLEGLCTHLDEDARHLATRGRYSDGTQFGVWSSALDDALWKLEELDKPLIAEAPAMYAVIRKLVAQIDNLALAPLVPSEVEARAILKRIDQ